MPIHFRGFDPHAPVRMYRRALPHWRQDGATYFVTWRLADSLPDRLLMQLEQIRRELLAHPADSEACLRADREYFRAMKHYLNMGHGACWMRRPEIAEIVGSAYRHFEGERYELWDHCVMPNHTHLLIRPLPGFELEGILHSLKSYTAKRINSVVAREGTVWQSESYDRIVRDGLELARTERYIRNNARSPEERDPGW